MFADCEGGVVNTDWMQYANCAGIPNPDIFYPDSTGNGARVQAATAALVCRGCPVLLECQAHGKRFSRGYGVWAGQLKGQSLRGPGRPKKGEVA